MARAALAAAAAGSAVLLYGCSESSGGSSSSSSSSTSSSSATSSSSTATSTTTTTTTITTTTTTTTTVTTAPQFGCKSSRALSGAIALPEKKGFAVDDPTVTDCSDQMLDVWPHSTNENVKSLRLFAAWTDKWDEDGRLPFWKNLQAFLERNDAKVLLGTGVHCHTNYDQQHWEWTLGLLKFLGKERVMGVAFGNEMDNEKRCTQAFTENKFFDLIKPRVDDMDANGFADIPVTVVWSMGALGRHTGFNGLINSFLLSAHQAWGDRWVWTFNPYPIWDKSQQPKNANECWKVDGAIDLQYTKAVMGEARKRVTQVTNNPDSKVWVGEAGWSSPAVDVPPHPQIAQWCPAWGSQETLFKYYDTLMAWDLSLDTGNAVDHLFFFTMRDAHNEAFGLLNKCGDTTCKVQAPEEVTV